MKFCLVAQVMNNAIWASLNAAASQGKEQCSAFIVM
jgi:hypothetical protein